MLIVCTAQLATHLRDASLKTCQLLWCSNARFESKFENSLAKVCESITLKVDSLASELILEPLKRNLDQVCGKALSRDVATDIKTPLGKHLDVVIQKVDRDTRDDKLLARCYDILSAARSSLAGNTILTDPGAANAAHAQKGAVGGFGGGGGGGGSGGFGGGGGGGGTGAMMGAGAELNQPPLPPDWEMKREGVKPVYVNLKTKQKTDARPVCPRESIKTFLQVVDDIFNDPKPSTISLSRLAGELGHKIEKPKLLRKAIVMVVGNGAGPQSFIEHYTGQQMKNSGLGCMHAFSVVSHGSSREIEKGDLALQVLNVPEVGKLRAIRGIERSIVAEQMVPGETLNPKP